MCSQKYSNFSVNLSSSFVQSALPVLRPINRPITLLCGAVSGFVRQHLELGLEPKVRVFVAVEVLLDHVVPRDGSHVRPRRVALRYEVLRVVPAAPESVTEVPERTP